MRALISVYDKTRVVELARRLSEAGYQLISTGGTHRTLSEGGLDVRQVADVTGSPEILEGRVKTLHPVIHGGLLARRESPEQMAELGAHGIETIDLVVVNLYPFVAHSQQSRRNAGRRAGKHRHWRADYAAGRCQELSLGSRGRGPGGLRLGCGESWPRAALRQRNAGSLAAKAFRHVSEYDSAVTGYLESPPRQGELPDHLTISLNKVSGLRYGENPHQAGALYAPAGAGLTGIAGAHQLHGRELSYNNLMDADAAWRTVCGLR